MKLTDSKVLLTGGGSGMGRAFALAFAREGADVAICDVDEAGLRATEDAAKGLPGKIVGFKADVSKEDDVVALLANAWEALGTLNVLVNNAGIFRDGLLVKQDKTTGAVQKMSMGQWASVIGVDLTGPFLCAREFAAKCLETGTKPAVIVNISSVSRNGNVGQTNYSAAKAGLAIDTKVWALELARYGIRAGCVAPGFIDTPILQGMRPEVLEKMLQQVPLRRVGTPEEIFMAVRFIVENDYFTGRVLEVDGGLVL